MAGKGPGEMSSIIKSEDLHVGDYIERLRQTFSAFVERDSQCPHRKFLLVMKRLGLRFGEIERGEAPAEGAQTVAAAQAVSKSIGQTVGGVYNEADTHTETMTSPNSKRREAKPLHTQETSQPAQGLHLLSEVAMSNNNSNIATPNTLPRQQQHPQQHSLEHSQQQPQHQPHPQQGWYAAQPPAQGSELGTIPMGPNNYASYQQMPMMGFEGFDYGLGSLGMGVDGAISGMFMADSLWNYNEPYGQVQPGWL